MYKTHFQFDKNCFSSKAKAMAFIDQYSGDILSETGFAPVRPYYSEPCQAWQVTSKFEAPAGYIKKLTSRYDQICHAKSYSRNSLKQNREHQMDALLYFIGTDILKAIKSFGKGDLDKSETLLGDIRKHLSYALDIDGEDAHKAKVKKFIAAFHKELRNAQEGENDTEKFSKYEEYFNKKHARFISNRAEKQTECDHKVIKKKIYDCYALLHNVNTSEAEGYDEEKKAMMNDAMVLYRDIAESNVCKYKRKQLKMAFFMTYSTRTYFTPRRFISNEKRY